VLGWCAPPAVTPTTALHTQGYWAPATAAAAHLTLVLAACLQVEGLLPLLNGRACGVICLCHYRCHCRSGSVLPLPSPRAQTHLTTSAMSGQLLLVLQCGMHVCTVRGGGTLASVPAVLRKGKEASATAAEQFDAGFAAMTGFSARTSSLGVSYQPPFRASPHRWLGR
jgi:hypothetical protein